MRRLAATASLALLAAAMVLAVIAAVQSFPRGITVLACLFAGIVAGWWGLVRRGLGRTVALGAAVLLLAGAIASPCWRGRCSRAC